MDRTGLKWLHAPLLSRLIPDVISGQSIGTVVIVSIFVQQKALLCRLHPVPAMMF